MKYKLESLHGQTMVEIENGQTILIEKTAITYDLEEDGKQYIIKLFINDTAKGHEYYGINKRQAGECRYDESIWVYPNEQKVRLYREDRNQCINCATSLSTKEDGSYCIKQIEDNQLSELQYLFETQQELENYEPNYIGIMQENQAHSIVTKQEDQYMIKTAKSMQSGNTIYHKSMQEVAKFLKNHHVSTILASDLKTIVTVLKDPETIFTIIPHAEEAKRVWEAINQGNIYVETVETRQRSKGKERSNESTLRDEWWGR